MEFFSQLSVTEVQERIAKHTMPRTLRHKFWRTPRNQKLSTVKNARRFYLYFSGEHLSYLSHVNFHGTLEEIAEGCLIRGRFGWFCSKLLPCIMVPTALAFLPLLGLADPLLIFWYCVGFSGVQLALFFGYSKSRRFQEREVIRFIETYFLK